MHKADDVSIALFVHTETRHLRLESKKLHLFLKNYNYLYTKLNSIRALSYDFYKQSAHKRNRNSPVVGLQKHLRIC